MKLSRSLAGGFFGSTPRSTGLGFFCEQNQYRAILGMIFITKRGEKKTVLPPKKVIYIYDGSPKTPEEVESHIVFF